MRIETSSELSYSILLFREAVRRQRSKRLQLLKSGCQPEDVSYVLEPEHTFLLGVLDDIRAAKRRGLRPNARIM